MIKKTIAAVAMAACGCAWGSTYTSLPASPASCAILSEVVIKQRELIEPAYLADEFEKSVTGQCLTSEQMAEAVMALESAVHQAGFIMAQVSVPPQNVSDGTLTLHYLPGYLSGYRNKDNGEARFGLNLIFPQRADGQLNIRDTELGMTHLNQLPGLGAQASVLPDPEKDGSSVIEISQQKQRSVRGSLGINNYSSPSTGTWKINNRLFIENPFQLYDRLFIYTERDLDRQTKKGSRMLYGQYRIPVQRWEFLVGGSYSEHRQHVLSHPLNRNKTDYFSRRKTLDVSVSRKLLLTPQHDMTLSGGLSVITRSETADNAPLPTALRRSVYWNTGLAHSYQHPDFSLKYQLTYKHSTKAFGALSYEQYRAKLTRQLTLENQLIVPFRIGKQDFYYEGELRGVVNSGRSDMMDYVTLSDRYAVRGYPFSYGMNAGRGIISRNEIGWLRALPGHTLYFAADGGMFGTKTRTEKSRGWLAGSEIGIKGFYKSFGYNLFAGIPLKNIDNTRTFPASTGFSVSVSY